MKIKKLFLENRKQAEINYCNEILSQLGHETFYVTTKGLRIGKNHHRTQKRKKVVTVIGEKTKTVIAQKKDFDVYRAFDFAIHQFMEAVRKIQLGEGLQRVVKKRPKKIMLAS